MAKALRSPEDPVPQEPPEDWPAIKIDWKDGIWRYHRDAFMDDRGLHGTLPPHVNTEEEAAAEVAKMYPGAIFLTISPT
jgi:hypothetical protein